MGAKFGKVDEADAHLSFDSPIPPGAAAQARFGLQSALVVNASRPLRVLVWNIAKEKIAGMDVDLPAQAADRDLLILSEGFLDPPGRAIFD